MESYGWNYFQHQNQTVIPQSNEAPVGRVVSIRGFKYHLIAEQGEMETELAGKLLYGAEPEDLPKVGDWVYFQDYGGMSGYIIDTLPRYNFLARRNPGNKTARQVLAANIDYALLVQSLDRDFNMMRLERYLTQITACQITPIVVLNKSDLVDDVEPYLEQVRALKRNCILLACSTTTGFGIEQFMTVFEKYKTYILVGSSGVGKSSLLNVLMNENRQLTSTVSTTNHKGRHTTTARDLFQLPNGSLLIDSPGMREFGATEEEYDGSAALFPAIDALASQCRFNDCKHINEAGCMVIESLHTGKLDPVVYESYIKLIKEQRRFSIDITDKKRNEKRFEKMKKEAISYRKKYKY